MGEKFEYQFRVAFHEVDPGGVMFYAHLFTRAHEAFSSLMAACGFDLAEVVRDGSYLIPIVHAQADYSAPLRFGDETKITVQPTDIGRSSLRMHYDFLLDDSLCACAETVHVFVSSGSRETISIPDRLNQHLQNYQAAAI